MLRYASLFSDLERLFASAGRDPASFARLAREVERVEGDLAAYCREVADDYVRRLERRLARPGAALSPDEVDLLGAYLGILPPDGERDRRLVEDLARLEAGLDELRALQERPLSLGNLAELRRALGRMDAVLPAIRHTLQADALRERFQAAAGAPDPDGGAVAPRDAEWLLEALALARSAGPTGEPG